MTATNVSSTAPGRLSAATIRGYALGSVGTGGFSTLPGLVLAYYLTDTLGVAAAVATFVVFAPKALDVVLNPAIGAWSDSWARRTGSRRRFLTIGAVLLPVFFALTFAVPDGVDAAGGAVWVAVAFIASAVAFSMFQVPYIAMPAELTDDYHERARLMAWRVAVLGIAILLFGAGGPELRELGGGGRWGYLVMGIVAGALLGLGMFAASRVAPRRAASEPSLGEDASFSASLRVVRSSRPFRMLLTASALQAFATGTMLAAAQYAATYVLGNERSVSILFAALVGPAVAVMPLWSRSVRAWGKRRAYLLASSLFLAATVALLGLLVDTGWWVYAVVAVAGVGYAGMQMLGMSMLPDVISDHEKREGGTVRAGAFSGVWTAVETIGLALGPALVLAILAITGFVSSTDDHHADQSETAINGIALAISAAPAILTALSIVALARYRLAAEDSYSQNGSH
ncbi:MULTISPECIES: MFS transporter [unclassified Rhodococcus (in: high G+C Gram-positive bacteria)]|uniref:MFS transporter n=1 Tax=unclassified Rhodococcus (in: high G+C Gram-positive bacteria) TaxID=192944 RepID=UPI0015820656|nr:MFS transporter [Rhodococcus sp. W8901]QKT09810.1 MFS transporter [Rhodococcus sp. W8901]